MIKESEYALWNSGSMSSYIRSVSTADFVVEGKGARVRDASGRWYLDARSGLWNVSLGYDEPHLKEAIRSQLERLPAANNIRYGRPSQVTVDYANRLASVLPGGLSRVRFSNCGTQAVETALLLSRFARRICGQPDRMTAFSLWGSFHGLGPGANAVSGEPYLHYSCGPTLPEVHHAPRPLARDSGAGGYGLEEAIRDYGVDRVTAVIVEPVMGTGIHVLSGSYLSSLQEFCNEHDIHLIFDEVSTGMGRVGALTRSEQLEVIPDMIVLGKGITSGYLPLSALAVSEGIYRQLRDLPPDQPFPLGSTTDGHPLAMAAGMAVLDVFETEGVLENAHIQGQALLSHLQQLEHVHPDVADVRGVGLMLGLELSSDSRPWSSDQVDSLRNAIERHGVLVSSIEEVPVIVVMPPLTISSSEVEEIVDAIEAGLSEAAE